ncbi:MAG: hypothetical protein JW955_05275 [Sedimentisphaerales bacterium]|nr:hypothetical protein [Sedimentisphaerales bacterium]
MKKSVLLLSMVLLAYSGTAQADGIDMSFATVSVSSFQVSMSTPSGFPSPCPSLCLIPPVICMPHAALMLCPTPNPCLILNPCVGLIGTSCIQPHPTVAMLGAQMLMATAGHSAALTIIANMH